jgi:hypothetical protein
MQNYFAVIFTAVHKKSLRAPPVNNRTWLSDNSDVYCRNKYGGYMTDSTDSLKTIVEEQRRDYDYLLRIYERAGAKENVLLTATFGILAYLYYTGPDGETTSIAQRLFVPTEDYGLVIYVIAAAFFVYGLFKLMFNVFGGNVWETAYESTKTDHRDDSTETLRYFKKRYDKCHTTNLNSYQKRIKDLRFCFYCILLSAIILIVIKTLK